METHHVLFPKETTGSPWLFGMFTAAACKSKGLHDEIHLEISDSANINAQYETY